ncbi:adenylyl cyclase [Candidatus Falkowbacteria bacterium HGW-Falkowbacteria-1]|uniref:Adenylyl cyclase n=1 Tax=Candidatus Falkowbacteria bacterium HGW-Falkowbacteria-1 TaxID=2013768 RepID=A0A2N2EAI7_9BACT|nr:MAG: adenylyl cyclase [Candidatus Falkowbacteria bacterium HGW-Falkowbacteria-1]
MKIEYEATFINVNKDEIRKKLKEIGASLIRPEFFQKRLSFDLPSGHEKKGAWLRVRDEGDKNTLTLKIIDGEKIEDQKEILLNIDGFDEATEMLSLMGCRQKAYQESKRELWLLDEVEVTIDEWPYLEPYVEVEGESEEVVRNVSHKLGFDYSKALFCSVDKLYEMKYGVPREIICQNTKRITFDDPNPFL